MAAVTQFFGLFHTFLQLKLYLFLSLIMLGGWIITAMEFKLKKWAEMDCIYDIGGESISSFDVRINFQHDSKSLESM